MQINKGQSFLPNLDFVRVCLMVCIVFYHSALFWGKYWFYIPTTQTAPLLAFIAKWLNSFHIYGFVFLSGYLFYYLSVEKGKYTQFKEFFKNKFVRLIIPYISISILWVIPLTYVFREDVLLEIVPKFLFGISPAQLWFLLMLFGVFMLFYKTRRFHPILLALGSFGISLIGRLLFANVFQIWNVFAFLPFFQLGYYSRAGNVYKYLNPSKISVSGYAFLQIVLFVIIYYMPVDNSLVFRGIKELLSFVCHLLGAFVAFHVLTFYAPKKNSYILTKLAACSFGIYLFHQQIIYVVLTLTVNRLSPYLITLVCFIISYLLAQLITALFLSNKYTAILIGKKGENRQNES